VAKSIVTGINIGKKIHTKMGAMEGVWDEIRVFCLVRGWVGKRRGA
jgi:hypothetical protein